MRTMHWNWSVRVGVMVLLVVSMLLAGCRIRQQQEFPDYLQSSQPANQPLPSLMAREDYEKWLYKWLMKQKYKDKSLGWAVDKSLRDTGPFITRSKLRYASDGADLLLAGDYGLVAE